MRGRIWAAAGRCIHARHGGSRRGETSDRSLSVGAYDSPQPARSAQPVEVPARTPVEVVVTAPAEAAANFGGFRGDVASPTRRAGSRGGCLYCGSPYPRCLEPMCSMRFVSPRATHSRGQRPDSKNAYRDCSGSAATSSVGRWVPPSRASMTQRAGPTGTPPTCRRVRADGGTHPDDRGRSYRRERICRGFDARGIERTRAIKHQARTIVGSAQDCSFSNWRLINSSACSASLLASGLNLMAAPLFGTIMRSNHTIRKGFTEM